MFNSLLIKNINFKEFTPSNTEIYLAFFFSESYVFQAYMSKGNKFIFYIQSNACPCKITSKNKVVLLLTQYTCVPITTSFNRNECVLKVSSDLNTLLNLVD